MRLPVSLLALALPVLVAGVGCKDDPEPGYDLEALRNPEARVNMRVRWRPIGLEILAELVESGDLDPSVLENTSTFDVAPTVLE